MHRLACAFLLSGIDVMPFDRWAMPPIAPVSVVWEEAGFAAHVVLVGLGRLPVAGARWRAAAQSGGFCAADARHAWLLALAHALR